MPPPTDVADVAPSSSSIRGTALWVLVVQCLLALSWTMYVLFLPGMLAAVGIERRWFVYVLMVDQLVFAACDWMAGVYVDRIAKAWRRTGRAIAAITLLSSAALLAMPWIAERGNAPLLLVVIFVWAATSSALRAPVFALLGRLRESKDGRTIGRSGTIAIALVGISLAGALGPYLTMLLKGIDNRLPIAVGAILLAVAGLWATRVEERLPPVKASAPDEDGRLVRHRTWSLAFVVLIAAFGTQALTAFIAQPLFQRFVGENAVLWGGCFWIGFGFGLIPGSQVITKDGSERRPLLGAATALVLASCAFSFGERGGSLPVLVIGIVMAGAAWGVFTTLVFAIAVALSGGRATAGGAGTASGLLFSALAVGTLLRLAFAAAGWSRTDLVGWLPAMPWLLAAVLLIVLARKLWRPEVAQA